MKKQIKFKRLKSISFDLVPEVPVSEIHLLLLGQHPNRQKRFLFTFPTETNIGEHFCTSVSNIRMKTNIHKYHNSLSFQNTFEWEDLVVKFTEDLQLSLFHGLISDPTTMNIKLSLIDPAGYIYERWNMDVQLRAYEFDELVPTLTFIVNRAVLLT